MSGKRWRQVNLRAEYYEVLERRAEQSRRSVAGELEVILIQAGVVKPLEEEVKAHA